MNKRIGFIGCGNMGKAMLGSLVKSKDINNEDIMVSTKTNTSAQNIIKEFNVKATTINSEVAKNSDIIFLAVKPFFFKEVIEEIKDVVKEDVIIIIKTVLIAVHEMNMTQYIMTLIHMTLDDPQSWRLEALAQIIVSKPMQITLTVPMLNSLMLSESYISLSQKPSYLQNLSVYLFDSSHCLS